MENVEGVSDNKTSEPFSNEDSLQTSEPEDHTTISNITNINHIDKSEETSTFDHEATTASSSGTVISGLLENTTSKEHLVENTTLKGYLLENTTSKDTHILQNPDVDYNNDTATYYGVTIQLGLSQVTTDTTEASLGRQLRAVQEKV